MMRVEKASIRASHTWDVKLHTQHTFDFAPKMVLGGLHANESNRNLVSCAFLAQGAEHFFLCPCAGQGD